MKRRYIVVGVDGSEESKAALRWALKEARLHSAELRVVHAWCAYPALDSETQIVAVDEDELRAEAEKFVREFVAETVPDTGGVNPRTPPRRPKELHERWSRSPRKQKRSSWVPAGLAVSPGSCSARSASSASTTRSVRSSWCDHRSSTKTSSDLPVRRKPLDPESSEERQRVLRREVRECDVPTFVDCGHHRARARVSRTAGEMRRPSRGAPRRSPSGVSRAGARLHEAR